MPLLYVSIYERHTIPLNVQSEIKYINNSLQGRRVASTGKQTMNSTSFFILAVWVRSGFKVAIAPTKIIVDFSNRKGEFSFALAIVNDQSEWPRKSSIEPITRVDIPIRALRAVLLRPRDLASSNADSKSIP